MAGMNKPALSTDFVKIGQSGKTIDGRTIDPAWLLQAAETYSPETYTALIWPDHFRFMNYGKVLELRTEEQGGVVSLLARLQPNAQFVWDNQYGQRLFFSMEIAENFAGSGKAYLVGLAITDSPASLGTDELKFATRHAVAQSRFLANVEFSCPAEDHEPSWFTRFRQMFTFNPEEPMDTKQFQELADKVTSIGAAVEELRGKLDSFSAQSQTTKPSPEATVTPAPEGAQQPEAFAGLTTAVAQIGSKLDALAARFETAKPGTSVPAGVGPADGDTPLY